MYFALYFASVYRLCLPKSGLVRAAACRSMAEGDLWRKPNQVEIEIPCQFAQLFEKFPARQPGAHLFPPQVNTMAAVYNSLSKPMGTKQPDRGNGNPQYRQRVLMLSSRGVTFR